MFDYSRQIAGATFRAYRDAEGKPRLSITDAKGSVVFDQLFEESDDADDLEAFAGMVRRMLTPLRPNVGILGMIASQGYDK